MTLNLYSTEPFAVQEQRRGGVGWAVGWKGIGGTMRQRSQTGAAAAAALGVAVLLLVLALPGEHEARGRRAVLEEPAYK